MRGGSMIPSWPRQAYIHEARYYMIHSLLGTIFGPTFPLTYNLWRASIHSPEPGSISLGQIQLSMGAQMLMHSHISCAQRRVDCQRFSMTCSAGECLSATSGIFDAYGRF